METVELPIGMIDQISTAVSEEILFQAAADWLPSTLGVSRGSLARMRDGSLHLTSFSGGRLFEKGTVIPVDGNGLASKAIDTRKTISIGDIAQQGKSIHLPLVQAGYKSLAIAPLMAGETCLGTLHALHNEPNFFSEKHEVQLSAMARWIASRLQVLLQLEEIRLLSHTDTLTNAANRRAFLTCATEMHERFHRTDDGFALVMIDVDRFKKINDRHGHACGDAVLRGLADFLQDAVQDRAGFVARLGGEEFAVLLPGIDAPTAQKIAEDIRQRVADHRFAHDTTDMRITLSIGVAEIRTDDMGIEPLMTRADQAMYAAKRGGRNRVLVAE